MPDIIQGVFNAESRRGLWWYEPKEGAFHFSEEAVTHYQLEAFSGMGSVEGWVRGAVVAEEGANYILIYVCDFLGREISGAIMRDIYMNVRHSFDCPISGILSEEGVLLDAGPWND